MLGKKLPISRSGGLLDPKQGNASEIVNVGGELSRKAVASKGKALQS